MSQLTSVKKLAPYDMSNDSAARPLMVDAVAGTWAWKRCPNRRKASHPAGWPRGRLCVSTTFSRLVQRYAMCLSLGPLEPTLPHTAIPTPTTYDLQPFQPPPLHPRRFTSLRPVTRALASDATVVGSTWASDVCIPVSFAPWPCSQVCTPLQSLLLQ